MDLRPVQIPRSHAFDHPAGGGAGLRISVALPDEQPKSERRLPALFVLDDYWFFAMCVQIVRTLRLFQEIPPVYIFGLGYPSDELADILAFRMRDYTPTPDRAFVETFAESYGLPLTPLAVPASGGGPAFRQLLKHEILPTLEADYPIDPAQRLLFGWSFSALFCLQDLFAQDRIFSDFIVSSPSLWWDDGVMYDHEASCAGRHPDLSARVHLSAGLEESASVVEAVRKLESTLKERSYPRLSLVCEMFAGETHLSVAAGAFSRGIRRLLGG